jgi:EAL and modified HD-GYP domain-containing signal transduction protein
VDVFVVRQPIFDRSRRTHAYELIFRAIRAHGFARADPDAVLRQVVEDASDLIGRKRIAGGRRTFLNFDRDTLVAAHAAIIAAPMIVVEVAGTAVPDAGVLDACRSLRKAGRLIALAGVVAGGWSPELVKLADIVTIDFGRTEEGDRRKLSKHFRALGFRVIATRLETDEDWRQATEAGYDYFGGDFFAKPVMVSGDIPVGRLNVLRLLHGIYQPDADLGQIERIIKSEVSLSMKLLTYMNSAAFGLRQRVTSIGQALLLLGVSGIRKWASVLAVAQAGGDRPFELVVTSVVRAKFCEQLAIDAGERARADDAFFLGLFSMLDALLGRPLREVLDTLTIADDVRHALLGGHNAMRRLYDLVLAYERGDWHGVVGWAATLRIGERTIPERYCAALEWGNALAAVEPRA